MSKTIQEQIEIMKHYEKFNDEVEQLYVSSSSAVSEKWKLKSSFPFDWYNYDYRIKEQKKTITIEKWLLKTYSEARYDIVETSNITDYVMSCIGWKKVKLLETYEVEL